MKHFEYRILKLETGWFSGGKVDESNTNNSHGRTRDVIMIFKREQRN